MTRHILRVRGRAPTEFANEGEVSESDAAALPSPTGREEGLPADDLLDNEPLSDFEEEVHAHEPGGRPMSEITGGPEGGTPDEDEDGLDEMARALRDAAEAPVGPNKEVGR